MTMDAQEFSEQLDKAYRKVEPYDLTTEESSSSRGEFDLFSNTWDSKNQQVKKRLVGTVYDEKIALWIVQTFKAMDRVITELKTALRDSESLEIDRDDLIRQFIAGEIEEF